MRQKQKHGRVVRRLLVLSVLLGVGVALVGHAPGRAHAASPAPPGDRLPPPVGYDSPQYGSKQYAYGTYVGNTTHLEELLYTQPNGWHYADLTALTGAPPLNAYNSIAGYDSPQFGSKQYAYVDDAGHVQELYYSRVNGFWRWNDLTALTFAPLVMPGAKLIGFDSPQFGSKEYAYIAQNGDIIELVYPGNYWHWNDLTNMTNAPAPASGTALVGFDSAQYGARQYAYLDSQDHLEEIFCKTYWCGAVDLTWLTGAPPAYRYSEWLLTGFDSPLLRAKQYAYIDTNRHLQELFYATANGYWSANDLTALYQAPSPPQGDGWTGFDSPQFLSKQYAYIDYSQGHLDEVSYWSGTWHTTDLTTLTGANADWGAESVVGFASPQFGSRQYGYIDWGDFEETVFVAGTWSTVDLTQLAQP